MMVDGLKRYYPYCSADLNVLDYEGALKPTKRDNVQVITPFDCKKLQRQRKYNLSNHFETQT